MNTGFGSLYHTSISKEDLGQLQHNLVVSHACGMGDEVPREIVRLMLLLKIRGLSYGHSGISLEVVERLVAMYHRRILPRVFPQGSLGASGDLAPLAHLSLPLIGMGEVWSEGTVHATEALMPSLGWEPLQLRSKEGLALLNGTQFMSAYGVHCLIRTRRIQAWANALAALSLEAFDGRINPFNDLVHAIRAQPGQRHTADAVRQWLEGSTLIHHPKKHVQDPYSFRCVPQVHGASRDLIDYVTKVVEQEVNSVTDNPTIFPDEDCIISAGNFHGQPLALALDSLALALAELGSISERRTYKLISGQRQLPNFLVAEPGLNSGFMIPQYTAASIVSQNKQLAVPASTDTIDSSNGQEDHVSMGANAATKTYRVVENTERILAIELFTATQAMEWRNPSKTSPALQRLIAAFREKVPVVQRDRWMAPEMNNALQFIRNIDPQHFLE
ncbi:MAG: histidine ammonia-lyase [Salibacteraceae bacterium]